MDWRGYVVGIVSTALATILKILTQPDIIATPNSLPYILAIVSTAIYFGLGPAIFTSVLSIFVYDYFFLEPIYIFTLSGMQEIPVLVIFLVVGIIVSFLAANLRHKNEETEELTRKVIASQEEERKIIARELHDDTSPTLAYLSLELDSIIAKSAVLPKEIAERLTVLREKINGIQQNVRRYSHELHPAVLENLGLEAALEALTDEMNSKGHASIQIFIVGSGRSLPHDVNLALYRITQEALNNIWKHAKATKAQIKLEYEPRQVNLSVTDNGIGFDTSARPKSGLGLTSMKERASLIGAKLRLESIIGHGTTVSVEVPV